MMKRILLGILGFYRIWISPGLHTLSPTGCKYHPTCSQYASEAIEIHGAGRGGWLALRRLMRCHPFSGGGFDPVPLPEISGIRVDPGLKARKFWPSFRGLKPSAPSAGALYASSSNESKLQKVAPVHDPLP
jgi:putative membrane protein insertion efficiency factor